MKKLLKLLPLSLLAVFAFIDPALAQDTSQNAALATQQVLVQLQNIMGVFLAMLNLLIWPMLSMIGGLMGNDLVFGPLVEDRLLLIWSQIRNLINLAFVLALVGIAIYNVAGVGEEGNYTIKKILPKFIIALIVINFTFFGAKVVLSATNVMTTAIFALPNSVETNFTQIDSNTLAAKNCKNLRNLYPNNKICSSNDSFTPQAAQFFSNFSADNISFIMAMNLANISDISTVSELVTQAPTIQNVAINILISTILYFIYGIAFAVLFIVLIVRVVVLWFVIALSPVLALQLVFPDATKSFGEFDIKDIFIKHAIAPVIIGLGMTIGYLMLDAYKQNTAPSLGSSLNFGADFANAFSVGTGGLQELMIGLAAAAIVWKVTFAAADGTFAKGITNGIQSTIGGFAKRVAALPKYIQWIPIPANLDNDGNSKMSLGNAGASISQAIHSIESAGNAPLGGRTQKSIMDHAKDPTIQNNDLDISLLTTLKETPDLQQNLKVMNLNKLIERMAKSDGQKTELKRLVKTVGSITDNDSVAKLLDGMNDQDKIKFFDEIKVITGAQHKSLDDFLQNGSTVASNLKTAAAKSKTAPAPDKDAAKPPADPTPPPAGPTPTP